MMAIKWQNAKPYSFKATLVASVREEKPKTLLPYVANSTFIIRCFPPDPGIKASGNICTRAKIQDLSVSLLRLP
jgi:hypothetical protein